MPPLTSSLSTTAPLTTRAPLAARESSDTPPNHIYETVSCSATNLPAETTEMSTIGNNVESSTNNLADSASLSDIFQTATNEALQNAKLDIKSGKSIINLTV